MLGIDLVVTIGGNVDHAAALAGLGTDGQAPDGGRDCQHIDRGASAPKGRGGDTGFRETVEQPSDADEDRLKAWSMKTPLARNSEAIASAVAWQARTLVSLEVVVWLDFEAVSHTAGVIQPGGSKTIRGIAERMRLNGDWVKRLEIPYASRTSQ